MVKSQNALPAAGALYVTISFKVVEINNKTFVSDGNSSYTLNVRNNRKKLLKNAIYNAIRREFPARTVTAYDIDINDYYYQYYLNDYEEVRKKNKYYETYIDLETKRRKAYLKDRFIIKDKNIVEYSSFANENK